MPAPEDSLAHSFPFGVGAGGGGEGMVGHSTRGARKRKREEGCAQQPPSAWVQRFIEWVGLGGTVKNISFQALCRGQRQPLLAQMSSSSLGRSCHLCPCLQTQPRELRFHPEPAPAYKPRHPLVQCRAGLRLVCQSRSQSACERLSYTPGSCFLLLL